MKSLAVAVMLLAGPAAAVAQDASKGDVFTGYSMLASEGEAKHGGHAALGWGVWGPSLGLLFDVSGHQGRDIEGTDVSVLSLMAGPRGTFGTGRLRPFVYVIGGVVRSKASVSVFDVEISESSTDFGGAAGGGLDIGLGARWAVRLAGDYRLVSVEGETTDEPRFSAGVVYRFAAR